MIYCDYREKHLFIGYYLLLWWIKRGNIQGFNVHLNCSVSIEFSNFGTTGVWEVYPSSYIIRQFKTKPFRGVW